MPVITGILFVGLFAAAVYFPVQAWRRWHGAWRWLGLLPLAAPLGLVAKIAVGWFATPPDYSLAPELLLGTILGGLLATALIFTLHRNLPGRK